MYFFAIDTTSRRFASTSSRLASRTFRSPCSMDERVTWISGADSPASRSTFRIALRESLRIVSISSSRSFLTWYFDAAFARPPFCSRISLKRRRSSFSGSRTFSQHSRMRVSAASTRSAYRRILSPITSIWRSFRWISWISSTTRSWWATTLFFWRVRSFSGRPPLRRRCSISTAAWWVRRMRRMIRSTFSSAAFSSSSVDSSSRSLMTSRTMISPLRSLSPVRNSSSSAMEQLFTDETISRSPSSIRFARVTSPSRFRSGMAPISFR